MGEAKALSAMAVLLADDDPAVRGVLKTMLLRLGCQVDTAGNGSQAVQAFFTRHYDLVFMDRQMPDMDGCQTALRIRTREAEQRGGSRRVPIVALSGDVCPGDEEHYRRAGMDGCLANP